jgi:hypothetical protein
MLSPIGLLSYLQRTLQSDTFEIFERLSRQCLANRYIALLKLAMRLLFILLFAPTLTFAQVERINYIRQQFDEINSNIESYAKVESTDINVYKDINPDNYSYESTEIYRLAVVNMVRYYRDDILVKAELTFDGDRQNLKSEYHFDSDGLLFAFQQQTDFDEPKWPESFDEQKKTVSENRYYFNSNKLMRWIDETGTTNELRTDKLLELERKVLSDAGLYRNYKAT